MLCLFDRRIVILLNLLKVYQDHLRIPLSTQVSTKAENIKVLECLQQDSNQLFIICLMLISYQLIFISIILINCSIFSEKNANLD